MNTLGQKCPVLNVNVPNLLSDSSCYKPSVSNTVLSNVKYDNTCKMSDIQVSSNKNNANSFKADNLTDSVNNEPLKPAINQSSILCHQIRQDSEKENYL